MAKNSKGLDKRKQYKTPRLCRYGDFRTLTRGGTKKKDEGGSVQGPKTRNVGAG
ncbi:MAG: lasso RiPP family leader peptide-containing protein [Gemmatimonadota bacterium]